MLHSFASVIMRPLVIALILKDFAYVYIPVITSKGLDADTKICTLDNDIHCIKLLVLALRIYISILNHSRCKFRDCLSIIDPNTIPLYQQFISECNKRLALYVFFALSWTN